VEDLVQAVNSQEKELVEKNALVVELQEQLARSSNFVLPFTASIVPLCYSTNAAAIFPP
jgi:hypothetical protein